MICIVGRHAQLNVLQTVAVLDDLAFSPPCVCGAILVGLDWGLHVVDHLVHLSISRRSSVV